MPLWSAMILLFFVMDSIGNVPLFVAVLSRVAPERRTRVVIRELLFSLLVLLAFLFAGRHIIDAVQVSDPALSIAGGVILLLIAIKMIFPTGDSIFGDAPEGEPLVVPLAVPFTAGPAAMATVLVLVAREPHRILRLLLALGGAWVLTAAVLLLSVPLSRFLGRRGLVAIERLMGMILTTIAVQMFLTGVALFLDRM
jgi:multiple antibiotic resistance protein